MGTVFDSDHFPMDIQGIAFDSDSLEDLGELDPATQLGIFDLGSDGRAGGKREPQPINQTEDRSEVYPEGMNYGLVAVECPNWMTVAVKYCPSVPKKANRSCWCGCHRNRRT